jgi:uncharacterized membrane protein
VAIACPSAGTPASVPFQVVPVFRRAFTGAAVLWTLALPFAPFLVSHAARPSLYAFAAVVYAIGTVVCHQRPERSFHLWGAQLPVCARCTGIYLAAAMTSVVGTAAGQGLTVVRPRTSRLIVFAAAIPTLATLGFEWTTGHTPSNMTRALAGVPLGAAVAWIVCKVN